MTWTDMHHYFDWCALQESWWAAAVAANPKTRAVNAKLALWHQQNPDKGVVNLTQWRIARARRQATTRIG